jgi:glutamate dehydrogenase/leucine dehydrogenase
MAASIFSDADWMFRPLQHVPTRVCVAISLMPTPRRDEEFWGVDCDIMIPAASNRLPPPRRPHRAARMIIEGAKRIP